VEERRWRGGGFRREGGREKRVLGLGREGRREEEEGFRGREEVRGEWRGGREILVVQNGSGLELLLDGNFCFHHRLNELDAGIPEPLPPCYSD